MGFSSVSPVAVVIAAIIAFAFGYAWHSVFAASWMTARDFSPRPKPKPGPLAIVFLAELVMAAMLAGVIGHIGPVTVYYSLLTAILLWAGFVLTAMVVDHSYEARPRKLTLFDAGHWLIVMIIMGLVIGIAG